MHAAPPSAVPRRQAPRPGEPTVLRTRVALVRSPAPRSGRLRSSAQPTNAPAFTTALVGKRLEVLWRYWEKTPAGDKPHYIWCSGTVVRVADGLTDQRSAKARAFLPGGAVLWAWDADADFEEQAGEQWLVLLPSKWNPKTHKQVYSWRYDPRELGGTQASPDERRKRMRCEPHTE